MVVSVRRGGAIGLLGLLVLLAAALAGLAVSGNGPLGPPPLRPAGWAGWLAARGPVDAAFALGRLAALALGWYLAAVTSLGLVARLARARRLVRVADLVTVPLVRRALNAALGAALAAGAVTGPAPADLAWAAGAERAAASSTVPGRGLPIDGPEHLPSARMGDEEWTVEAGQHFWSIAEQVVERAAGGPPRTADTARYWQALIESNRDVLADPANPDLIYPGQQLRLPPVG